MNKQSKISQTPPVLNFDNQWMEHPWIEWLIANKQIFLWMLGGLFALILIAYRIVTYNATNAEADYFKAQADFAQFQESADLSSLASLEVLMQKRPELHARYDGPIAETLLIENQFSQANAYAQAIFKRTADDSIRLYHQFAATSLLIQEGKYAEALAQSQVLKDTMDGTVQNPYENVLYVYNAVRLGLLNQQMGLLKEGKQVWDELRAQALQSETTLAVLQLFKSGQASFDQFADKSY